MKDLVGGLCGFNREIPVEVVQGERVLEMGEVQLDDEEEEKYETNLNLNYRKLKEKYDDRVKKKILL